MVRIDARAQRVRSAQLHLVVMIDDYAEEHDLTTIEVLQAVNMWSATALKYMLRAERGDVTRPADEERSAPKF